MDTEEIEKRAVKYATGMMGLGEYDEKKWLYADKYMFNIMVSAVKHGAGYAAATPAERFKKPTDEQFVEFAIVVNNGGLDPEKLTDMVAMCQLIVDRLYENGDMLIPSSKENNKNE